MAKRYVMIIDLRRCVGCNACSIACKQAWPDKIPPGEFRTRIKEIESGKFPNVAMVYRRTACMHCADAPCVKACPVEPVKASRKTPEGVTIVDDKLCIQCGACVEACPYKVRYLNTDNKVNDKADACNFCYPRIQKGEKPACTVNCVGNVFTFGDIKDPEVQKKLKIAKPLKPEFKTKPSVYYIPFRNRRWDVI